MRLGFGSGAERTGGSPIKTYAALVDHLHMASETIRIMCPALSCRKILAVPSSSRGKHVRCKNCGATIRVPDKMVAPVAPVAAAAGGSGAEKPEKQPRPAQAA